jgi:hypothetical protein
MKKTDKKILLPITAGFLYLPFIKISKHIEIANHSIVFSLATSIAMTFAVIPLLISRYNMRKAMVNRNNNNKINKCDTNESNLAIELIYNKGTDIIKRNKFLFIFLSSLADFTQTLIASMTYNIQTNISLWLLDIIFLSFLSYLIFKQKLFRHQILSMIIIIIFGFIMDFIFGNFSDALDNIGLCLLRTFCEFSYSLSQILNKYTMEYKFSPPYEVCLFIGIFSFFFHLICLIIASCLPCDYDFCEILDEKNNEKYFDNFRIYFSKINGKEFILVFIEMIILFLMNILTILTIKFYTPFHLLIILIIGKIMMKANAFFIGYQIKDIINIISLILILIGLLVFVEVIILNFCGIQKNTRDNIEKRGALDIISEEDEDSSSIDNRNTTSINRYVSSDTVSSNLSS